MSAFNNRFHIKEENGVITNVDEIKSLLEEFDGKFSDEEYRYVESLITFLSNSEIKNKYPLITLLNKYKYNDKLNNNGEASEYLKMVLGMEIGIVSFKSDGGDNYYFYYYKNKKIHVLECMQIYDLANYVNTYVTPTTDRETIIDGYINYLTVTLNFNPIPKEVDLDDLNEEVKLAIEEYMKRKRVERYHVYQDSKGQLFIIAGSAIIRYDSKMNNLYYLKSENVYQDLKDKTYEYEDIHVLLPFEIDIDRLNEILDNFPNINSYERRYLEAAIKTIIEKPELLDDSASGILTRYIKMLNQRVMNNTFILTKIEKEFLARAHDKVEGCSLEKTLPKFNGGYIVIAMEVLIIAMFIVTYISLAK